LKEKAEKEAAEKKKKAKPPQVKKVVQKI